jgi:hypothetical protein
MDLLVPGFWDAVIVPVPELRLQRVKSRIGGGNASAGICGIGLVGGGSGDGSGCGGSDGTGFGFGFGGCGTGIMVLRSPIAAGAIDPAFVISHRLRLEDAPAAHEMFLQKAQECIKVVLCPS